MKKIDLYSISKSRDSLFGIATLLIAFFHSLLLSSFLLKINGPAGLILSTLFDVIKNFGNIGVDIFLFLSGLGLYFSFSKNNNVKQFYKKRMLRLIPESVIIAILFNAIWFRSAIDFILSVTFTDIFTTGYNQFWFISLMIVLYLAYPFIHRLYENKGVKAFLVSLLIVIAFNTILKFSAESYYLKIEIMTTRIPVFLAGVYSAKFVKNHKEIPVWTVIISAIVFIVSALYIFLYRLNKVYFTTLGTRYLYAVIAISFILVFSFVESKIQLKHLRKFLVWIGGYSIEVYLIFEIISSKFMAYSTVLDQYCLIYTAITFSVSMVLSIILKKISNLIVKRLS